MQLTTGIFKARLNWGNINLNLKYNYDSDVGNGTELSCVHELARIFKARPNLGLQA